MFDLDKRHFLLRKESPDSFSLAAARVVRRISTNKLQSH